MQARSPRAVAPSCQVLKVPKKPLVWEPKPALPISGVVVLLLDVSNSLFQIRMVHLSLRMVLQADTWLNLDGLGASRSHLPDLKAQEDALSDPRGSNIAPRNASESELVVLVTSSDPVLTAPITCSAPEPTLASGPQIRSSPITASRLPAASTDDFPLTEVDIARLKSSKQKDGEAGTSTGGVSPPPLPEPARPKRRLTNAMMMHESLEAAKHRRRGHLTADLLGDQLAYIEAHWLGSTQYEWGVPEAPGPYPPEFEQNPFFKHPEPHSSLSMYPPRGYEPPPDWEEYYPPGRRPKGPQVEPPPPPPSAQMAIACKGAASYLEW
ncbi:hypothetical protein KFL_007470040 [Klebsormidium nitens]|uniref:Uncharacterized protein n=1 Tax=Klebsormidium nitens TaxID=105231 RepID=A0A1Y1IKC2_KLENI|nr:hypothetical protein KFL_007470040 [Klebsormidium nitens]|eukprot:GAQ91224.1 hypothetical protein KFL_007470040 [Klebsormidium nitens]